GHPLVRPLFWPDAQDPDLWGVQDAFLLGDALLIAPVLEEGSRAREVTLPAGTWYESFGDRAHRGPVRVSIEAPLERLPVLVRAGSVLPMEERREADTHASIVLHVYPPEEGEGAGAIYSDAGDGYGSARLDRFILRWDGATLRLLWNSEGEYTFPYSAVVVQVHGMTVRRAVVDGVEVPCEGNRVRTGRFREASLEP
ncbi:MAG: alpha-glucosidase, partial [Armatimonadota bacterium]